MNLRLAHRRLAVLMGLAGLLAFAAGAGFEPLSAVVAAVALVAALFWQPGPEWSERLERVWLPVALLLVARALWHVFLVGDDVVIPVVDLLLLLLAAESLRSLEAVNDIRLYALSFALLLAATAYRPGVVFLLAFVAYVVLSTLALVVGHLRRSAERHGVRSVRLGRRFVLTVVGLGGVTLAVSAVVFLTFPRVSRAWPGRGEVAATSIAGFSDEVSLGEHGARIYANPRIVLRVEFPDGRPDDLLGLHWRGRSYDHFDGVRWSRSEPLPPASAPTAWYRERWGGRSLEQRIYAAPLDVKMLFALHPVLGVDAESRIQPLFDNAGDFFYWGSAAPVYTAWSVMGQPPPGELREAEQGFMPSPAHYLQLPELPERILALADSLTAGHETRFDKAVAVERWLRTSFEYTLELPATAQQASLEHFLFERRAGHCEYFSTAMAVLLRAAGVQTRNVNGFLGGQWSDVGSYLAVTQNQAHSWVEVWFPGYGWVTFDPTPGGSGVGSATGAWFWPGRFAFDALQHRWNKWVLDYSIDAQWNILDRLGGLLDEGGAADGGDRGGGAPPAWAWVVAAAALAATALAFTLARDRATGAPETRLYLRLVEGCRGAGLLDGGSVAPLELVDRLDRRGHPAAAPARRLVAAYLRARFGGETLGPGERKEMQDSLSTARRALRREPPG